MNGNEVISGMLTVTERDNVYVAHLETAGAKELLGEWTTIETALEDLGSSIRDYLRELREGE